MRKYLKTYEEKCTGCNTCMTVCSTLFFKEDNYEKSCIQVIKKENGGFALPVCDQCTICVEECHTLALTVNKKGVVMLNKNLCIGCYACVAVCPTETMMTYHGGLVPFKCTACGACAKECPSGALEIVEEEI
jgi:Fe-S-cluster-containing hydrogenase component 2